MKIFRKNMKEINIESEEKIGRVKERERKRTRKRGIP